MKPPASVALIVCLFYIQLISTTQLFEDDYLQPDLQNLLAEDKLAYLTTDGFRIRREVVSEQARKMLQNLSKTPGWKYLDKDVCGKSAASVSSRRKRSDGQELLKFNGTSRIFGGTEVKPGQFPWMARIVYRAGLGMEVGCGGALVSKWHVLTAAHCIAELPPGIAVSTIRVGVGKNEQNLGARAAYYHRGYNSITMGNDIGIIKVSKPAQLNDFVSPLCLPLGELVEKSFLGRSVTVAGWGRTETSSMSEKLLMVDVPVISNKLCGKKITLSPIKGSQLCAGGEAGKDSCTGDSGGPLFLLDHPNGASSPLRYTIIGVVSYGPTQCGTSGVPGVYSRVTYYLPWILKNME